MTHAYAEFYLQDAMMNLGEAFDYAVNVCNIEPEAFMDLFIASGFAEAFGKGVPKVVSGLSGTELVMEITHKGGLTISFSETIEEYDYSAEYWCGWILAYYQWYSGKTFKTIMEEISILEILKLYPTLHEASEEKFIDVVTSMIIQKKLSTRIQSQRKRCGLSQRDLAEKAGIKIRTLQQYEARAKNINKASVSFLASVAQVLGCRIEDLLE